jgi:ATP-dependent DNA helicase RecG
MTTEAEVLAQIAAGEDQFREFKRAIDNPESIAGELVAFANTDGGRLFLGVDDDGAIVGLPDPAQTLQTLTNICRDRCRPPVIPGFEQVALSGQTIIVLSVEPALNRQKPYSTQGGRFFVRVGADKKDATGRELIRIAQSAGELHYDESPVRGADLNALSEQAFGDYYERQFGLPLADGLKQSGLSLTSLLTNMRLMEELDGAPTLTVAGVLMFGESPQRFLPHSRLSAVAFSGQDEDSDILDRLELTERLPQIIDAVRVFLKRNVRVAAQELGFERRDFPQYDLTALGEAIVNAIVHRDYSLSGSQIRVFVFADRIEVRSPGRLPNSVTLDNIRLGVHAERNRRLATLLTHLGYMSAIGTGVPRLILRLSRQLSNREPEYALVGEELRLTIWGAKLPPHS